MGKPSAVHNPVKGLAVAVAYAIMSMSLALLNKGLLSSYAFPCYFTLLGVQLALSLAFCIITRDYLGNPFDVCRLNAETVRLAAPMAVAYVFNVTVGMVGLQLTNVPMFFAIRRLVPACIVVYEWSTQGKQPDRDVKLAVTIIAVGAMAAGWETFTTDMLGYGLTMLNNLITAAMFVMQKSFSNATGLSTFSVVLANSVIALPLTAFIGIATGELPKLLSFPHLSSPAFAGALFAASAMGLALTYTSVLCTTYNSPLATSVTGNVKDVFTTTFGWLLFGGFRASPLSMGGLGLSFSGAAMYSLTSLRKSQAASAAALAASAAQAAGGTAAHDATADASGSSDKHSDEEEGGASGPGGAGASSGGTAGSRVRQHTHSVVPALSLSNLRYGPEGSVAVLSSSTSASLGDESAANVDGASGRALIIDGLRPYTPMGAQTVVFTSGGAGAPGKLHVPGSGTGLHLGGMRDR